MGHGEATADSADHQASPRRRGLVFISHEKADHALALDIRTYLETGGFSCWLAPENIAGPTPWPAQIARAIDDCHVMLVVVSAHANQSSHVSREVDIAVEHGKPLLPVRVEDIAPSGALDYLLRLAQWIDLFPGSVSDHANALQTMVESMLHIESPVRAPVAEPEPPTARQPRWSPLVLGGLAAIVLLFVGLGLIVALGGDDSAPDTSTGGDEATTSTQATATDLRAQPDVAEADTPAQPDSTGTAPFKSPPPSPGSTSSEPAGVVPGIITRISVASDGTQGNDHSLNPAISANGRYVAFDSLASNLVDGDAGSWRDVFVHDRRTGETTRISEVGDGEANGASHHPQISADGRYIAFASDATNLDPTTDDANDATDIYLHDRQTGQTRRISKTPDGTQHTLNSIDPSMSDDATLIAYATYVEAASPPPWTPGRGSYTVWVYDRNGAASTRVVELDSTGESGVSPAHVASDGSMAVAATQATSIIFDRASATSSEVQPLRNVPFPPVVPSADGRVLYFGSWLSSLVLDDLNGLPDIFSYEFASNEFALVFEAEVDGPNFFVPSISSISIDGRYLAGVLDQPFRSTAVVIDTVDGSVDRVLQDELDWGADRSFDLSGDGSLAVFSSTATDLVADGNGKRDVFVIQIGDETAPTDSAPEDPEVSARTELTRIDGSEFGGFGVPIGVAIDAGGQVLVTDETKGAVRIFDAEGTYLSSFAATAPHGIAVGPGGAIYTTSWSRNIVEKFDADGNLLLAWGRAGTGPGEFDGPIHVAVDPLGFVYVTEGTGQTRRVQKFDGDGRTRGGWTDPEEGSVFGPLFGIAVGESESGIMVFVGEVDSRTAFRSRDDGHPAVGTIRTSSLPNGLDVDAAGDLYVAGGGLVERYDVDGNLVESWTSDAFRDDGPSDIAVAEDGDFWVTDQFSGLLIRFG